MDMTKDYLNRTLELAEPHTIEYEGRLFVDKDIPVDFKGREAVCCGQCPYLSASQRTCQLNKAPVQYPDKYVGYDCPLVKEETT